MNALLVKLGMNLPIIQAPMAGISTAPLAAAVSNAGGLGSIGVGNVDAETARGMIAAVRAATDRPFNVNVFCHAPAIADHAREAAWLARLAPHFSRFGAKPPERLREIYKSFVADDSMLGMLVEERPKVVSFHFGLPAAERIAALRAVGIVLSWRRPRISTKGVLPPPRESTPLWRRGSKPAATAAFSIRPRATIAWE